MCRFVMYQGQPMTLASLVTEPSHSIIHQSAKATESDEPLNGDGFGVAWYVPEMSDRAAVFRSVTPAWSNINLLDLARVTRSPCILAHVRAATRGLPVTELNCHPFTHGRFTFMHNGDVARFGAIRRRLLHGLSDEAFRAVKGSTDSEHLFAMFLDRAGAAEASAAGLAGALEDAVAAVVSMSRAAVEAGEGERGDDDECDINVAVTDGVRSAACRFTTATDREPSSLYVHTGRRYECDGGVCRMVQPERGRGAVIVCSEPLSEDSGWQKIPANHLVMIGDDLDVRMRPLRGAA